MTANELPLQASAGGTCSLMNSGVTGDAAGTLTSMATLNAGSFNLMPPSYTGTAPNGIGLVTVTLVNSSSGAPNSGGLACWDTASAGTVTACTATKTSVAGVAYYNNLTVGTGASTYSQVVRMGSVNCTFDVSPPVLGHYVTQSGTTPSDCHDAGSTYPASGQVIGLVLSSGSGSSLIFAMNDLTSPGSVFAGVGSSNSYASGTNQNFEAASSLTIPVTGATPAGADGTISYNAADQVYDFGENGLGATAYPVILVGTPVVLSTPVKLCATAGGTGCQNTLNNDTGTHAPQAFGAGYYNFPGGFFTAPGRTVRVTYLFRMVTPASGMAATEQFSLGWGSSITIYESAAFTPPTGIGTSTAGNIFQAVCTITADTVGTAGSLLANCHIDAPGSTASTMANTIAQPVTGVDTTAMHADVFSVGFGSADASSLTLLSATTEVLQ